MSESLGQCGAATGWEFFFFFTLSHPQQLCPGLSDLKSLVSFLVRSTIAFHSAQLPPAGGRGNWLHSQLLKGLIKHPQPSLVTVYQKHLTE